MSGRRISSQRHDACFLHHVFVIYVQRDVEVGEADEEVARLVHEGVDDAVDAGAAAVFGEMLLDLGRGLDLAVVAELGDAVAELDGLCSASRARAGSSHGLPLSRSSKIQ